MIIETAIFAMGCFWCGDSEFRDHQTNQLLPGILSIRVGYAGGVAPNPTYENHPGYKEAVKITYDPQKMSYDKLLDIFWHNIDPFDANGQFCDQGFAYTSAIFFMNEAQKLKALSTKAEIYQLLSKNKNSMIATEIIPYTTFYDAEEVHQDYKSKNPVSYRYYRWNCGRDKRIRQIWIGEQVLPFDQKKSP